MGKKGGGQEYIIVFFIVKNIKHHKNIDSY